MRAEGTQPPSAAVATQEVLGCNSPPRTPGAPRCGVRELPSHRTSPLPYPPLSPRTANTPIPTAQSLPWAAQSGSPSHGAARRVKAKGGAASNETPRLQSASAPSAPAIPRPWLFLPPVSHPSSAAECSLGDSISHLLSLGGGSPPPHGMPIGGDGQQVDGKDGKHTSLLLSTPSQRDGDRLTPRGTRLPGTHPHGHDSPPSTILPSLTAPVAADRASSVDDRLAPSHLPDGAAVSHSGANLPFFFTEEEARQCSLAELFQRRCQQLGITKANRDVLVQLPGGSLCGPAVNAQVECLDFSGTYLGRRGCIALAAILPLCRELKALNLRGVGMGGVEGKNDSARDVFCSLGRMEHLRQLNVSANALTDRGGAWLWALVNGEGGEPTACALLQELDVSDSQLSTAMTARLCARLEATGGRCIHKATGGAFARRVAARGAAGGSMATGAAGSNVLSKTKKTAVRDQRNASAAELSISSLNSNDAERHDDDGDGDNDDADDVEPEDRKFVPEFVAAALVELRQRLLRNRHCVQRIYDCFVLPESVEKRVSMARAAIPSYSVDRAHHSGKDFSSEEVNALLHMELLGGAPVDEAALVSVQQGTCSWKAFFRGLRLLGIHSASKDLSRAITFASVCGVLGAETVQFGKLLNLLRAHAVLASTPSAPAKSAHAQPAPVQLESGAEVLAAFQEEQGCRDVYDTSASILLAPHGNEAHDGRSGSVLPSMELVRRAGSSIAAATVKDGNADAGRDSWLSSRASGCGTLAVFGGERNDGAQPGEPASHRVSASIRIPRTGSVLDSATSLSVIPSMLFSQACLAPAPPHSFYGNFSVDQGTASPWSVPLFGGCSSAQPARAAQRRSVTWRQSEARAVIESEGLAAAISENEVQFVMDRLYDARYALRRCLQVVADEWVSRVAADAAAEKKASTMFSSPLGSSLSTDYVARTRRPLPFEQKVVLSSSSPVRVSPHASARGRIAREIAAIPLPPSFPLSSPARSTEVESQSAVFSPVRATSSTFRLSVAPPHSLSPLRSDTTAAAAAAAAAAAHARVRSSSNCLWPVVEGFTDANRIDQRTYPLVPLPDERSSSSPNDAVPLSFGSPCMNSTDADDESVQYSSSASSVPSPSANSLQATPPYRQLLPTTPETVEWGGCSAVATTELHARTEKPAVEGKRTSPNLVPMEVLYGLCTATVGVARQGVLQCVLHRCGLDCQNAADLVDFEVVLLQKLRLPRSSRVANDQQHREQQPSALPPAVTQRVRTCRAKEENVPASVSAALMRGGALAPQEAREVWESMTVAELKQIIAPL